MVYHLPAHRRDRPVNGAWCVPSAASSPGLTRPRRSARRPGPPKCFYHRPHFLPPGRDPRLIPLGRLARRELHAPPDPVQQQIRPGQGVLRPEPPPDDIGDPRQRPALILPALRGRPSLQHRRQLAQLRRCQLAPRPAGCGIVTPVAGEDVRALDLDLAVTGDPDTDAGQRQPGLDGCSRPGGMARSCPAAPSLTPARVAHPAGT
jgi:hypothetical protein